MQNTRIQKLTAAAMLIAVGIIIPMFMPIKLVLEPASYTLASHVAIFLAMFISPTVAAAVSIGTTVGFLLGGFPLVVVLRAATHLVFAVLGALYLQRHPSLLENPLKAQLFSFIIGIVHALGEIAVVSAFYVGGSMGEGYYAQGFAFTVMGLVGLGTIVHSMIDFLISLGVLYTLRQQKGLRRLFPYAVAVRHSA